MKKYFFGSSVESGKRRDRCCYDLQAKSTKLNFFFLFSFAYFLLF